MTDPDPSAAVFRKVAWRLLPFLGLCYFTAFLDRVNVGMAALTMNRALGLSATAFGTGAGIFFIGYFFSSSPATSFWSGSGPGAGSPASPSAGVS